MIPQPIDQVPLFVRLTQEERELVTARLSRRQVQTGQVIFAAGQPSDALYVIIAGWAKLEDPSTDRRLTLANLGAGSLVGEVDTLIGRPYTTSARAAANTQLLTLSKADLQDLIAQHPSIGLKFSTTLGMRIAYLEPYLVQQRLRNVELLSSLSEDDLRAIAQNLDFKSFSRGDILVEAGAPGDAALLVEEGEVRLISESPEGNSYEDLAEGALYGHTALVTGKPYPATARAVSDVSAWVLPRAVYLDLIRQHPSIKMAFSRALAETLGPSDQTDAVERIRLLPLFSDMPTEALSALVTRMVLRHFPMGEVIYAEGSPGDAMYVIEAGEVKLLDSMFSDAQLLERMHAGDSFGEMALLTGRTRAECARATSDSTIWVLYKSDFDDLMVRYPEISVSLSRAITERLGSRENDFLVRHLRHLTLLSNLASSELRVISNKVKGLRFRPGEVICFAGQPAQTLYMIEMGEVKRIGVSPSGEPILIDLLGPGDSIGEQAIVQNTSYTSTAQAIGQVELWTISKSDFLAMLEQYPTLALTVTRVMADRLSRNQTASGNRSTNVRGTAPLPRMPSGPRTWPTQHPPAPPARPGSPRPLGGTPQSRPPVIPPSAPRIQRPPSGARPVKPTTPRPSTPSSNPPLPPSQPPKRRDADQMSAGPMRAPIPSPSTRQPMPHPSLRSTRRLQESGATAQELAARNAEETAIRARHVPARRSRSHGQSNFLSEWGAWLAGLSFGAKVRATALTGLFFWFAFIALPATAITTVTSAVGGLQIFNPPVQTGTPQAKPVVMRSTTTKQGNLVKVAFAVATETPVPTRTPRPTATRRPPTRVPATRVPATAAPVVAAVVQPTAPPAATLPAAFWDPRLGSGPQALDRLGNVRLIPANVPSGQKFWRAVSVKFEDISEAGNDHSIYVKIVDENNKKVEGKTLQVSSDSTGEIYPDQPQEKPSSDLCDCNFSYPMFGDGYNVQIVNDLPSDKVAGMIMPVKRHVNYRVILQLTTMP